MGNSKGVAALMLLISGNVYLCRLWGRRAVKPLRKCQAVRNCAGNSKQGQPGQHTIALSGPLSEL